MFYQGLIILSPRNYSCVKMTPGFIFGILEEILFFDDRIPHYLF